MTLLGDLFGYDMRGNDLLGYPEDESMACPVCGVSASAHTKEMEAQCLQKLYKKAKSE